MTEPNNFFSSANSSNLLPYGILLISGIIAGFFYLVHADLYAPLSIILFYPVYRWILTRHTEDENERSFALTIFHISLFIRLLWVFAGSLWSYFDYNVLEQDYLSYDILAKEYIQYIFGNSDSWLTNPAAYRAKAFNIYMGFIYLFFNYSILAVLIGNAFMSATAASFLYLAGKRIYNERTGKIAALMMVFFIPSIMIDARLLKESLVLFLVSYMILLLAKIQIRKSYTLLFEILLILTCLYFTRIYYAFFLIPALLYVILANFPRKQKITGLAIITIFIAVIIYQELQTPSSVTLIALTQTGWFRVTGVEAIDKSEGVSALIGLVLNPSAIVGAVYRGIKFIFFMPIYFYIQGVTIHGVHDALQTVWSLFSGVMWALLPGIIWAVAISIKKLRRNTFSLFSFLLLAVPFFGLKVMTNRYKLGVYVILFLFAAYGLENRRKWLGLAPFYLILVMLITLVMLDRKMGLLGLF